MKYPKPQFNIGDKIKVDDLWTANIGERGLFKKNGKVQWSYKLKNTPMSGFWASEDRIKLCQKN